MMASFSVGYAISALSLIVSPDPFVEPTPLAWHYTGLAPGSYTFGSSPLTGMPTEFAVLPTILSQDNNDGEHYVVNRTTTGFQIVDMHSGSVPIVTVLIIQN